MNWVSALQSIDLAPTYAPHLYVRYAGTPDALG